MKKNVLLGALSVFALISLKAQGPIDGFFNQKGKTTICLGYSYGSFDEFFVGTEKIEPVPAHDKIEQTIYNLYVKYGITDKLELVLDLPYIKAEGNGDPDPINGATEQSDFQDVTFYLKYAPFETVYENYSVKGIIALGGTIPFGYEPNGILSIGNGAPAFESKVGLQLSAKSGFFGLILGGYTVRGKADNNLGVGDGQDFDAPNGWNSTIKLGYAGPHFYVDAWIDGQSSDTDIDIFGAGFVGNFPETAVNFSRVGATFYLPFNSAVGVSVGGGTVVTGRNLGNTTWYTGGISWNL